MKYSKRGGEAIASGAFGCVFKPSLPCSDGTSRENYISKLMFNKNAFNEMKEIDNVKTIIDTIPNNEKYFIPNSQEPIFNCSLQLDKIKQGDLDNSNKCKNLKKDESWTRSKNKEAWIRENIPKLELIQQPDGGIDLSKYLKKIPLNKFEDTFNIINSKLIDLIEYGIIKMNEKGLLHLDIKADNMVYNDNKLRLIDWGFATKINRKITIFQPNFQKHLSLWNSPFSSFMLFDIKNFPTNILNSYNKLFSLPTTINKNDKTLNNILDFFYSQLYTINDIKVQDYLLVFFDKISIKENEIPDILNTFNGIWKQYIIDIIKDRKFRNLSGNFDQNKYFENVYKKNVDIYGALTTYVQIYDLFFKNEELNTDKYKNIKNNIKEFLTEYFYNPFYSNNPYNTEELINALKQLNTQATPNTTTKATSKATPSELPPISEIPNTTTKATSKATSAPARLLKASSNLTPTELEPISKILKQHNTQATPNTTTKATTKATSNLTPTELEPKSIIEELELYGIHDHMNGGLNRKSKKRKSKKRKSKKRKSKKIYN